MSLTLITWLLLVAWLAVWAMFRPILGVALYLLTTFLCPPFWWWGQPVASMRWNFYSGVWLLICSLLSSLLRGQLYPFTGTFSERLIGWFVTGIFLNMTFVHFALAPVLDVSAEIYWEQAKFVLLFFLMVNAIQHERDLRALIWTFLLGAGYIGYEATINKRGRFKSARLEGIGMPNAYGSNDLACLLVTLLPLVAPLFMAGKKWERWAVVFIAPLIVNVILLCNSRGAFLGCIFCAVMFLATSPRKLQPKAWSVVFLGMLLTWMLLGDERIVNRFLTITRSAEQRDRSAASRLEYWQAGLRMIADFPLGAGGNGFHNIYGPKYIKEVNNEERQQRSVHNGFINTACDWGIQGFLLTMGMFGSSLGLFWITSRRCARAGLDYLGMLGIAFFSGTIGHMITSFFSDLLDNEWSYWMAACAVGYSRIARQALHKQQAQLEEQAVPVGAWDEAVMTAEDVGQQPTVSHVS